MILKKGKHIIVIMVTYAWVNIIPKHYRDIQCNENLELLPLSYVAKHRRTIEIQGILRKISLDCSRGAHKKSIHLQY